MTPLLASSRYWNSGRCRSQFILRFSTFLQFTLLLLCAAWVTPTLANARTALDVNSITDDSATRMLDYISIIQPDTSIKTPTEVDQLTGWTPARDAQLTNFSGASWSRFTLANTGSEDRQILLLQENPQLRDITLWEKQGDTFTHLFEIGEMFPFAERPIDYHLFLLPLTIKAGSSQTFYLYSSIAAYDNTHRLYLWDRQQFFESVKKMDLWELFYFGIIFVMICYNLVIFVMTKDKSYLYYSLYVTGAMAVFLSVTGWGYQLVWPNTTLFNQRISYTGMAVMFSFAGWFSIEFLSLRQHFPRLASVLSALCVSCYAVLFIYLATPFDNKYFLVRVLSVISIPIFMLCWTAGVMTWIKVGDTPSRIFTCAWSILILMSILTLAHEAIYPIFPVSIFVTVQISHALEVVALSMALANRITQLKINESFANAKADSKSKFLARMSHEIRTPMNGILGISDLLSRRLNDKTDKHYIDIIHGSAKSLEKIINDILDYSKVEAGKLELEQKPFNLRHLVRDVCDMFELECHEKSLVLEVQIHDNVADFYIGDATRVRQLLINLLGNAIKYTHEGQVKIKVSDNKHLRFDVSDTGIGIAPEDLERLFAPFEQAISNNLGRDSSTGLGLAICSELAALMNGSIQVQSRVSHGSVFSLNLPLPITLDPKLAEATDIEDDKHAPLNFNRILIAEDNQVNKMVISSILANLGVPCHIEANGEETLKYYQMNAQDVDVILMDCEMPIMNGFEATRAIRAFEQQQELRPTPIIALTAHTWHQELQQCYQAGMDDLLLKPITKASVRKVLALYQPASENQQSVSDTHPTASMSPQ
ncbi:Sensory/regulatory protein RpfC [BD1-7 clade bacterium]|uniref:histidine kinase n=1 Tax=BD1-7 clade bacterium TaxID=2029982 RepID=A0A5S9PVN5_9GAMM|nr:Sensory/regulatory protein RpfC [BD1-7 clade bacterium]